LALWAYLMEQQSAAGVAGRFGYSVARVRQGAADWGWQRAMPTPPDVGADHGHTGHTHNIKGVCDTARGLRPPRTGPQQPLSRGDHDVLGLVRVQRGGAAFDLARRERSGCSGTSDVLRLLPYGRRPRG
jgi:hypothetical protein